MFDNLHTTDRTSHGTSRPRRLARRTAATSPAAEVDFTAG